MMLGKMITLEGVEGAGKSTQLVMLVDYLRQHGVSVVSTREPGGTLLGEKIRGILLNDDGVCISDESELLLMFTARQQHLQEVIKPALAKGQWVVCDRFIDASYAYQSGGRGMDQHRVQRLEDWVLAGFKPDLTLLLDVPVSAGFSRIQNRGKDRIEQENSAFFERVRRTYLQRAESDYSRIKVIDSSQPVDVVANAIQSCVDALIALS
ncbi:MAG TPA: dTMP kinase [Crenotrichaceae bacterium]|nr:dTMP kinase [Crenotrichaceae bacterium]